MNTRTVCSVLILGGLIAAAPATLSSAQSGAPAPKESAAPAGATAQKVNPVKHRYWRHRGGKHPHYGSRRVRT